MTRNYLWVSLFVAWPLLLLALLAVFLLPGRKKRRKPGGRRVKSVHALSLLLFSGLGTLWLVSMTVMTLLVTLQMGERLYLRSREYADWMAGSTGLKDYYDADGAMLCQQYEDPARFRWHLLEGAVQASRFSFDSYGLALGDNTARMVLYPDRESRPLKGVSGLRAWYEPLYPDEESRPFEGTVVFLDGEGKPLFAGDTLYFQYASAEEWAAGLPDSVKLSCGWVSLPEAGKEDHCRRLREERLPLEKGGLRSAVQVLRITAPQPGPTGEFRPAAMDMVTKDAYTDAFARWTAERGPMTGTGGREIDDLDRAGYLEWEHLFGDASAAGEDMVTVYALLPELCLDESSPVALRGPDGERRRYDGLRDMLLDRIDALPGNIRSFWNIRMVSVRNYRDPREDKAEQLDLFMVTAVAAHPLRSALRTLWPVFLTTLVLALGLGLLILRIVRRWLLGPVEDVADGMAGEWYNLHSPEGEPALWREAEQLKEQYRAEQDRRRYELNERRRLERAVEYAKAAEEERRLLTSNLAHELKTPLAVVHSYAEGLREHIAEEKREQYLDTILSESERMDALVMQMLDLSRLEAGKVKLSRDGFDLRALAEATLEKLRPLAEERGLTMTLEPGEACEAAADESRIAQAAENLLVNALRYAPAGSWVRLRVETERKQALFRVENPVEKPFTPEEQEKVWEPFYRRDKARSGGGTGLGLSIVRQIVELHGGTCGLRNTAQGVEFWFTLPL